MKLGYNNLNDEIEKYSDKNKYNAYIKTISYYGKTPLLWACQSEKINICLELLKYRTLCKLDKYNKRGDTPLMIMCKLGYDDICIKMLETPKLCNIKKCNNLGYNALMIACSKNLINICKRLLELRQFFNINTISKYGETIVSISCDSSNDILLKQLISIIDKKLIGNQNINGSTVLMDACYSKNNKIIKILLNDNFIHYCNFKACDKYGNDALYYAINNNLINVATKIINNLDSKYLIKIMNHKMLTFLKTYYKNTLYCYVLEKILLEQI